MLILTFSPQKLNLKKQSRTRSQINTGSNPHVLTLAELCEGIDDSEKELAAAWELAREVKGHLRQMTNRNKRGRKTQAIKAFLGGKDLITPGKKNLWFHEHFNSWALTFPKSRKWPGTCYADLKDEEKWEAFPEAPVFQKSYLQAFKSDSLASAAEMITPHGGFKRPWSGEFLDQLFAPIPRPIRTGYRLIKIDTSFPMELILSEIGQILREHCPHQRPQGGNIWASPLRNLALYRAHKAGWGINEMEKCWKKAKELEKNEKAELSQKKKYGSPPAQKIRARIELIKQLLKGVF